MQLDKLLPVACTLQGVEESNPKRVFEYLSQLFAERQPALKQQDIFTAFINRERLGSTAIGHGIAIPHIRLANITQPLSAFLQLKERIDFDAPDNEAVDLIFALIVPEDAPDAHLNLLAQLAQLFSSDDVRTQLRNAVDHHTLHTTLLHAYEKIASAA